jgi:hypothetical protein
VCAGDTLIVNQAGLLELTLDPHSAIAIDTATWLH